MDRHIIASDCSLLKALDMLNALSGGVMTLFVTGADGTMVGTLTDGDVRRGLLKGAQLTDPVEHVMNRSFRALRPAAENDVESIRAIRRCGVRLIPRLDAEGRILEIMDLTATTTRLPLSAILMAGGKGERLRPMTLTTPKPLLKIGSKAIIDYNITALARAGITDVSVTVNYLAEQLEAHFSAPVEGIAVKCVRETEPMGTIGSAALVKRSDPDGATLVMNSDILTTLSLEDMYLAHLKSGAAITIAAIPYNISVPYAILSTDETGRVTGLQEKPSYSFYANAGIYIIANRLLDVLPPSGRTDATDLIETAIADGRHVGYFPISGTWIDIGSPTDFAHASELMRHHLGFSS